MIANTNEGVDLALENQLFLKKLIMTIGSDLGEDIKIADKKEAAWALSNILAGTV